MANNPTLLAGGALAVVAYLFYVVIARIQLESRRKAFKRRHGCQPAAAHYPSWEPFGLTLMFQMLSSDNKHEILPFLHSIHKKQGKTVAHNTLQRRVIITCDLENIKTALATKFDDWELRTMRNKGFKDLLGDGVFTTDGAAWAHSRGMLRPNFEKAQTAELDQFEDHIPGLLSHIPTDGSTVDLCTLFHQFTIDASSEFLTGTSTNSLDPSSGADAREFVNAFDFAMLDGALRFRLGNLYYMWPRFKAWRAINTCHSYIDRMAQQAVKYTASLSQEEKAKKRLGDKYVFINELAKNDEMNAVQIRNETLNILLAGRDTTASLLSNLWLVLARRPDIWRKLQEEVDALHGELPTYNTLKNVKYLKYCIQETLRIYPPVPFLPKLAVRDTVLPHGGGPDGKSPLFAPKDTVLMYNSYALMRDPDIYGPDAEEFKPERWADPNLRPMWGYIPFGGGPRVCLGQQYALNEAYYVTIRLMQNFRKIENRDPVLEWKGTLTATSCTYWGTKVALGKE